MVIGEQHPPPFPFFHPSPPLHLLILPSHLSPLLLQTSFSSTYSPLFHFPTLLLFPLPSPPPPPLRSEHVPANLIQAQRDYFGAHTYELLSNPGKSCLMHELLVGVIFSWHLYFHLPSAHKYAGYILKLIL